MFSFRCPSDDSMRKECNKVRIQPHYPVLFLLSATLYLIYYYVKIHQDTKSSFFGTVTHYFLCSRHLRPLYIHILLEDTVCDIPLTFQIFYLKCVIVNIKNTLREILVASNRKATKVSPACNGVKCYITSDM